MGVSKVVYGNDTLVDLTGDSVNADNLLEGASAHGANGEPVTGGVRLFCVYVGTCTGQAANQEKAVVIPSEQGFILKTGALIAVKFDATNTYSATAGAPVKLNVNSTGAKQVYGANTAAPTGTNTTYFGRANYINYYIYDGTYWVWAGSSTDNNTTYSAMSTAELIAGAVTSNRVMRSDYLRAGIKSLVKSYGSVMDLGSCETAANVAEKVVTMDNANWSLEAGCVILVKFTASNTAANPTLNVNGTGAIPIWYNAGIVTTSSLLAAGRVNCVIYYAYDGTNWLFLGQGLDSNTTYTNMSQSEATAGTATTARTISAGVLNKTIKGITDPISDDVEVLKERTATIYGFHINGNESDPDSMVTYLEDAVGMTPAYMNFTTGAFNYGSWQNAFFMPKPCMLKYDRQVDYYLNPNDYTKKADGTASDIADSSYGGNAMMEFPKIWLKVVPDASSDISGSVYIADRQVDSDYNDFAYVDYLGVHKDKFYMPCYNGSVINNVMRSISGVVPSNKYNATQERTYAKANGNGWDIESLSRVQLINFLLILISKSTNSQEKFGRGLGESGTEEINNGFITGVHNARGLFYGTNSGAASTYTNAVKVFGIENWWGYQWRRYTGDILLNGQQMVKFCSFTEDGSTVQDYNITGDGYIHVANADTKSGTNGGYISQMKFSKYGMFSKVSSGSYTTYFTDGQWYNNSGTAFAIRGGGSGAARPCGALYVARNAAPSFATWYAGAAVSCA